MTSTCFKPIICPYPIMTFTPQQRYRLISDTDFISQFTSNIGDISINVIVFVASNVSIQEDEGTPFHIGLNVNLQEDVILTWFFK